MAPDPHDRHPDGRPVLSGLAALVVATVGIGIVLAGGLFLGTQVLGAGAAEDTEGSPSSGQSLVIPSVSPKSADDEVADPPFTDTPRPTLGAEEPTGDPTEEQSDDFTLTAGSDQVAAGERLDLTGTFPGATGTSLEVERLTDGSWNPFEVNASVDADGTYATYIFTNVTGETAFRMTDPATGESSNEVEVTIG